MNVRELITVLGFKTDETAVRRYEGAISGVKTQMAGAAATARAILLPALAGLGAAAGYAAYRMTREFVAAGDELEAMAEKTGVAKQALQELRYAADMMDVSQGELDQGLAQLVRRMGMAKAGQKGMAEAFRGIDLNDPAQALEDIADRLARIPNVADRARLAAQWFGKGGLGTVNNFLAKGGAQIRAYREHFRKAGYGMSDDAADMASNVDNSLKELGYSLAALRRGIGATFAPVLQRITEGTIAWINANRQMIRQRIDRYVDFISDALTPMIDLARKAGGALSGIASPGARTDLAAGLGAAAFMFGRQGVLGVALVLFLEDLQKWRSGQKSLLELILGDYVTWVRGAKAAWQDWVDFVNGTIAPMMTEFMMATTPGLSVGDVRDRVRQATRGVPVPAAPDLSGWFPNAAMPSSDALVSQAHGAVFGSPNRSTTVNSNITVNVPPGTPDEQKRVIDEAAAKASARVREEWMGMLRQGIADTAVVE